MKQSSYILRQLLISILMSTNLSNSMYLEPCNLKKACWKSKLKSKSRLHCIHINANHCILSKLCIYKIIVKADIFRKCSELRFFSGVKLISISDMGTFSLEEKCLELLLKLSLHVMTATRYRRNEDWDYCLFPRFTTQNLWAPDTLLKKIQIKNCILIKRNQIDQKRHPITHCHILYHRLIA